MVLEKSSKDFWETKYIFQNYSTKLCLCAFSEYFTEKIHFGKYVCEELLKKLREN